ncbi:MAG: HAMP domain-containing histidine kinase [Sulfurimonas sp.]|nr:HAMP domain-containing histidine kinase [Sulfurimonas sp.]
MKKVERESLIKSFLLFFISQAILLSVLFFIDYKKELQAFDDSIFSKMRICSLNLKCDEFQIDFVPMNEDKLYRLHKDNTALSSYFSIPNSTKNSLKIYLLKDKYNQKIDELKSDILLNFFVVIVFALLLSFAFALYALYPLKNALRLTEEFIKDILHDFNTPLSTLRLNSAMLEDEIGENSKVKRIQNSVQNILNLQSNLRSYLHSHSSQKEEFDLKTLLEDRVSMLEKNFHDLEFIVKVKELKLSTNRDAFTRVIDNLLTNAAKYNKKDGKVILKIENNILYIEDTGKGIKNPSKVFERFYKEQERGIGIGLHIVKKLCEELDVKIGVKSIVNEGTSFFLNLKNLI